MSNSADQMGHSRARTSLEEGRNVVSIWGGCGLGKTARSTAHEHLTEQDYVATTIGVRLVLGVALDGRPAMVFADAWGCV